MGIDVIDVHTITSNGSRADVIDVIADKVAHITTPLHIDVVG